jgi:hypothetical protein
MDMNEYALHVLAHDRLAELRANGERLALASAQTAASRPLRVVFGHALIRLGRRLQGARPHPLPRMASASRRSP